MLLFTLRTNFSIAVAVRFYSISFPRSMRLLWLLSQSLCALCLSYSIQPSACNNFSFVCSVAQNPVAHAICYVQFELFSVAFIFLFSRSWSLVCCLNHTTNSHGFIHYYRLDSQRETLFSVFLRLNLTIFFSI